MVTRLIVIVFVTLSFFIVTPVSAADLELIESRVIETTRQRSQQQEEDPSLNTDLDSSFEEKTAVYKTETKVYWSALNGLIEIKSLNEQLYLSIF